MSLRQITAPATLAVDLAAVKTNMRIDGDDMDDSVTGWVEGVTAQIEHDVGQCMVHPVLAGDAERLSPGAAVLRPDPARARSPRAGADPVAAPGAKRHLRHVC